MWENLEQSRLAYESAIKWTPGGSQTMSKAATRFPLGAYPAAIERGEGSHVWTVDGREMIDWICSLAALTLGHGHRAVCDAVQDQLWKGISFSLPHRLEAEVAERLCSIIPCAEMVRFTKTGSEANEAAIRVARAFTARDVIVTVGSGYHSWHSWFAAVKPEHPGVPEVMTDLIRSFKYNDLDSVDQTLLLAEQVDPRKGAAAVILEPMLLTSPAPGFLEGVRDLAHQHGALLIFDEVVTGFRWARAGGQEYFGVSPDLATFGKGMTGIGVPLACLVGRRDIMQHAVLCSGTFGGDCLGLAACNATLDVYEREPVIEHLWKIGTAFMEGIRELIAKHGLPAKIGHYGVHPKLEWTFPDNSFPSTGRINLKTLLMSLFLQETAERGILLHPGGWNVSYAHTEQDLAESLAACDAAFGICAEALADGKIRERLRGEPIQEGFKVRA